LVQVTDTVKDDDDEKGWNLDDEAGFDEEDEEDVPTAKPEADPKAEDAMDLEEGGDEIDPLDAFMADNDAKVAPIKAEEQAAVQGNMHTCCTRAGNPLDAQYTLAMSTQIMLSTFVHAVHKRCICTSNNKAALFHHMVQQPCC